MTNRIQLLPSGIPLVDSAWGGFYRGGTYFLIGPRKSGRTLLALQYALECAQQKEVCIFFTSARPKDLMIHAASIDFDLQHYMNQNLIIVVRVTPPVNLEEVEDPDSYLSEYMKDIVPVVEQYQPNKLVFDELTYFVGFKNLKLLNEVFLQTTESIEDAGITSLYTLAEPANPASQKIVDLLLKNSTGIIDLQKQADVVNKYHTGVMTITPNVGHTEGKFSSNYYIEPYKGITVDFKRAEEAEIRARIIREENSEKYKALSEIEVPGEVISLSNVYSLDDFELIVNNQIALYQITGQIFTLVAIRLDEEAEKRKLLTLNQLRSSVRLSTDKKDKICTIGNKILVMITKEVKDEVANLVARIKTNLPNDDPNYVKIISRLISISSVRVSDKIQNAEGMIALLLKNTSVRKDNPGIS